MDRMRIIAWRGLIGDDAQTREWMAGARTPGTRARIRRWARLETVGIFVGLPGVAALVAAPFATLVIAVWFAVAGIERTDVYWWLWGTPLGLAAVGLGLAGIGSGRRRTACYADGSTSVGRVDEVITHPGSGDDQTWYHLLVSAGLPDEVVLHRKLYWSDNYPDPHRLIGRPIRFRHNTADPDDLHDILFAGLPGAEGGRTTRSSTDGPSAGRAADVE